MITNKFISATKEYSTFYNFVPAPYMRKTFEITSEVEKATIAICGLGFYEFYLNGKRLTKGLLAPYISNPDDILYYDVYDIKEFLTEGKNTVAFILGNGMLNSPGGTVWDFETALFRSAPKLAVSFECKYSNGESLIFDADESFKCAPSPIYFNDLRAGEFYDARNEISGWNKPDFDDSGWTNAFITESPRGHIRECKAEPIVVTDELSPIAIRKAKIGKVPVLHSKLTEITPIGDEAITTGWLYEYEMNASGLCRLKINGKPGQKIILQFGEALDKNGDLDLSNMWFLPTAFNHRDIYVCRGGEEEIWMPSFTYHGFKYCLVIGLEDEQATKDLLTFVVMNSDIKEMSDFNCSNDILNKLQSAVKLSDRSNFYYFPTDCPHREKNGWTGDASLSAEQLLLNFTPEKSFREWLNNIRKSQREDGALPGIVPTSGWGFSWGNGPAWDAVIVSLPYFVWRYRGDTEIIRENALAIMKLLNYYTTRRDENGLIAIGLGDWRQSARDGDPTAPLKLTDTIVCIDIARKAAQCFDAIKMPLQADFARALESEFLTAARKHLIDHSTMTALGCCQTSQAMALFYGIFENGERTEAFKRLVEMIEDNDGLMDVGILGGRVIFRVLSEFGRTDLAYKMVTDGRCPSYAYWINKSSTTLWEEFCPRIDSIPSLNHHFWGDISGWMIEHLAGITVNPNCTSPDEFVIFSKFIDELDFVTASHNFPKGKLTASWKREGDHIILTLDIPEGCHGEIKLERSVKFSDGQRIKKAISGEYTIIPAHKPDICRRKS